VFGVSVVAITMGIRIAVKSLKSQARQKGWGPGVGD